MNNRFRPVIFAACVLAGLTVAFSAAPACAMDRAMVRTAQMRLADLGYFSALYDGKMGPVTAASIRDFQRHNQLPATGRLDKRTYHLLMTMAGRQKQAALPPLPASDIPAPKPDVWHFMLSQKIPVRGGDLVVEEEDKDATHRFTVKLNGQPFLTADNQPGVFQISQVFNLNNEDALVMTAFRGDDSCTYVNYLVTIDAKTGAARKHEFESCSAANEVHEAFQALFVRFSPTMNKDGFANWDVWRYENANLIRL